MSEPRTRSRSPPRTCEHPRVRHMFLLAGQSNMAGRGPLSEGCASVASELDTRIAVLGDGGCWHTPAKHPLHSDKPEKVGVGPGLAFARAVIDFLPSVEQNIGLIPCAVGGSELERWMPSTGDLFRSAVDRVRQGIAAGGVLSGILWHQGESDSGTERDASSYEERLRAAIKNLRIECGTPDVPIVLGELGTNFLNMDDERFRFSEAINKAIAKIGSDTSQAAVASARGLDHRGDRLHFSAVASDEFGKRYAWKWLKLTGRLTVSLITFVGESMDPPLLGTFTPSENVGEATMPLVENAIID